VQAGSGIGNPWLILVLQLFAAGIPTCFMGFDALPSMPRLAHCAGGLAFASSELEKLMSARNAITAPE
jgi:hypothetical protein